MKIYNTLTREKSEFKPLQPRKVSMYVCGMTVYDYCHLGHGRVFVAFDVIVRYLRAKGYDVNYIRNITDIDDKIIRRAQEANEDWQQLVQRFIDAMDEDFAALGIGKPNLEPKATEHIGQIIAMVQTLIDKGMAYAADNGDVYYVVEKFAHYGQLSGKVLDDLRSGARVEVDEAKQNPLDFVLWKAAKPGEPSWESPWGKGRPGWHIECSAMSTCCLGNTFDIHGGGPDLKFPHHENEIAQSEAATGEKYANIWMHAGALRINDEKMSKSLGNFFTIRDVLADFPAEVVRYFLLASHYRSPINYSIESLKEAGASLERFYHGLRGLTLPKAQESEFSARFYGAMDDDFNTPEALAVLFDMVREINRNKATQPEQAAQIAAEMKALGDVLGLLQQDPEAFFQQQTQDVDPQQVENLIEQRNAARKQRDFAKADEIRDQLLAMGVVLEDSREGTKWRVEK
ncbi:cysteine--tRNA ligase [Zooshikella sp. RANM57]|uniref:cysteine--tRNA ligase n=1 Tax=Zooshikella sp. RANM57 TaxID=3425863 RepID=UPI003D6DE679